MNFSFLVEYETENERSLSGYAGLLELLQKAEAVYWDNPRQCGVFLREAAADICRIYNQHYEIGFPYDAGLEEFLCYTGEDAHNVLVSRFLSVVKKEQRERLNKLRVLGDDCACGETAVERELPFDERMAQNARRMMEAMMEAVKEMCVKIDGRSGLDGLRFSEEALPGRPPQPAPEENSSFFDRVFRRKRKD